MSVKILVAGCLPRDRGQIEGVVRRVFQNFPESDPWNVSLVKLGTTWSISMEGPEVNNFGLSAPEDRLQETIAEALGTNGTTKEQPAPPPPMPEGLEKAEDMKTGAAAPPAEDRLPKTIVPALGTSGTPKKQPAPPLPMPGGGLKKSGNSTARAVAPPNETKSATGQDDRYECHACKRSFKVVYVADPGDAKVKAPIACPSCWEITEVSVPEGAAATEEYSAELDG